MQRLPLPLDPVGPAYQLAQAEDRKSGLEQLAWIVRRADDLTGAWTCGEQSRGAVGTYAIIGGVLGWALGLAMATPAAPVPAQEGVVPASEPEPFDYERHSRKHLRNGTVMGVVGLAALFYSLTTPMVVAARVGRCRETKGGTVADCAVSDAGLWHASAYAALTLQVSLMAAGGAQWGKAAAFKDIARGKPAPRKVGIALGGVLVGAGGVAFLATHPVFWSRLARCRDGACARLNAAALWFSADVSAVVGAVGGMLLGYGLSYRRTRREHPLTLAPALGPGMAGLQFGGRF